LVSDVAAAPVAPRYASTVILLRDRAKGGVETFLLRRPARSSFAAEAHVFPGGTVDAADSNPAVLEHAPDFDPAAALTRLRLGDDGASSDLCAGHHIAAVREVFEESGILLGSDAGGAALDAGDAPRLAAARHAMLDGASFAAVLDEHHLRITPERLVYVAHFVTPEGVPKRFDTRFFAITAPPGQDAAVHAGEASHGDWNTPQDLLDRHRGNFDSLMPPTRIICSELARHRTVQDILDDLGSRPVARILFEPHAVMIGNLPELLPRPGDAMTS
jgi:8-oxo-dGTP pyrophosphatase MutT (NUDIX family)